MKWGEEISITPALPRGVSEAPRKPAPKCIICKSRNTYRTILGHPICSYCEEEGKADKYKRRW